MGRRLAARFLAQGHRVGGTFLGADPGLPELEAAEVDLGDRSLVASVIGEQDPDVVIHLGGLSHVGASWQRMADYFQVNVMGTENLLRGARGRRVLFASSSEVYGLVPEEEQPIREDRAVAPRTPYALTKAAAERLALAQGAIVVRSFNAVGPGQAETFALPAFTRQLAAIEAGLQEPVLKVGNLEARRDFVHIDDVAEAYCRLAERGEEGKVYNLASGIVHSIGEALSRLVVHSRLEVQLETDPERVRPVDMPLLCGDASALRGLGWSPTRGLDQALQDLWSNR
ncbi:MAG: GDP-mannose 4,6-dehydratase [Deltaproteobacteria bacterium]|nr:GDP-mannose 4,6-dehydratase [Deltaproteobacteria bacterium]